MGSLGLPFEHLPLGFRFKPTDAELIDHYLRLKINGNDKQVACITEVDICKVEPWDLPDLSAIKTNDHEWFFFCPRDRKYPNGQRSNRATGAGYWKATGKDRTIKSRKMGLIGMKKTLVFYRGRAPKGIRTYWVIHEYRTTLQELDGTNPGQGAYVLCRLFKKSEELKHDDNDDGSNTEEVETNVVSPTTNSLEDVSFEPAVVQPLSKLQPTVKQLNGFIKTSDSMTSETVLPDHSSHSNSFNHPPVKSQVNEEVALEVNSHLNEAVKSACNPFISDMLLDQMHGNQGPTGMGPLSAIDFGDENSGLLLPKAYGRDPIIDFLDSAIIDPDDYIGDETVSQGGQFVGYKPWLNVKDSGSCSGSDVEVVQVQADVGFTGYIPSDNYYNELKKNEQFVETPSLMDNEDVFSDAALDRFCNLPDVGIAQHAQAVYSSFVKPEDGINHVESGINIRPRIRQRLQKPSVFTGQGTAPRRMCLQMNLGPLEKEAQENESSSLSSEFGEKAFNDTDFSKFSPDEFFSMDDFFENTEAIEEKESSVDISEIVEETGIKIRAHLRRSLPTPSSIMSQGTANRRIRLMKRSHVLNSEVEEEEANEIGSVTFDGEADEKPVSHNRSVSRPPTVSAKRSNPYGFMMKVFKIVVLFFAVIGLWKTRQLIVIPS